MSPFNRTVQRVPAFTCFGVVWAVVLIIALSIHQYLGLVVLFAPVVLALVKWRTPDPEWVPNVCGENAYQILGVDQGADAATLRRAFRRLQQAHHPDAAPTDRKAEATALFIRIGRAYEVLSDREKRFQYDYLIETLDGRIPPFEEAYQHIKDEHKHPIYAAYDDLYGEHSEDRGSHGAGAEPTADDRRAPPEPTTTSHADEPTGSTAAPASTEPAGLAVEVEMPDAVREALGLPPTARTSPPDGEPKTK